MIIRLNKISSLEHLFKRAQLAIFILTMGICTLIFMIVSAITMNTYAKQSLNILSNALNERIQPAVVFNDKTTINQILSEYINEYPIRSIVIQDQKNQILGSVNYQSNKSSTVQDILDRLFFSNPIVTPIQHKHRQFGTITLYGSSINLAQFFFTIFIGLSIGILIILVTLLWSVRSSYQFILKQISPILGAAKTISSEKSYYLRLPTSDIKEFQSLSCIFNSFLEKIQASTLELKEENSLLSYQAKHDQLTQLPNRHYFYQVLFQFFNVPQTANAALLFIDNNNFKDINDKYGHLAGDAVLKEMALRLKDNIRKNDFIARLGGDEFAILVKDIENEEQIISICTHLLQSSKQPLRFSDTEIAFSFSIGVSCSQYSSTPEHLITEADHAMYVAKTLEKGWYIAPITPSVGKI